MQNFNYKDFFILQSYIRVSGKIIPKRLNNLTTKKQRQVSKAIKNARIMSFLLFFPGHDGGYQRKKARAKYRARYRYIYKKKKKNSTAYLLCNRPVTQLVEWLPYKQ